MSWFKSSRNINNIDDHEAPRPINRKKIEKLKPGEVDKIDNRISRVTDPDLKHH